MRQEFEHRLRTYGEMAKDQMSPDLSPETQQAVDEIFNWFSGKTIARRELTPESQEVIFDIQKKKQEIMKKLKEDIRNLDNPEFREEPKEGQRRIVFQDGQYIWEGSREYFEGFYQQQFQARRQTITKKLDEDMQKIDDPDYQEKIRGGRTKVTFKNGQLKIRARNEIKKMKKGGGMEIVPSRPGKTLSFNELLDEYQQWDDFYLDPKTVPRDIREKFLIEKAGIEINRLEDEKQSIDQKDHDVAISIGEIMTDMAWDVDYYLDPDTVPRNVRKEYLIEKAKQELRTYLDQQILTEELSSKLTSQSLRGSYEAIKNIHETRELQPGHYAEILVTNFFRKLSYDFEIDFSIVYADVFQDVNQKIDFIIRRKKHHRGVGVEEDDSIEAIGVQFTTQTRPRQLEHKKAQIKQSKEKLEEDEIIEDIILVMLPLKDSKEQYQTWISQGRPPGGPEKLWDESTKALLFSEVLKGMMTDEEIQENRNKIFEYET